jgi:hypothetical protein
VALVRAIEARTGVFQENQSDWRGAMLTAPTLLDKLSLITPADKDRLVKLTAARMRTDPQRDTRPALLVHLALAAAGFAFQQWVLTSDDDQRSLQVRIAEALEVVLHPRWKAGSGRATGAR